MDFSCLVQFLSPVFHLTGHIAHSLTFQDGEHSVRQHAATQAGPAAEVDRGEAKAEEANAGEEPVI